MYSGDEREILHIRWEGDWVIILSVMMWIWLSMTVTILSMRESARRAGGWKKLWMMRREDGDEK